MSIDPKLIAELVAAELRKAGVVQQPPRTADEHLSRPVRELWDEWEPTHLVHKSGNEQSRVPDLIAAHRRALMETELELPQKGGKRRVKLGDLAWCELSPSIYSFYLSARQKKISFKTRQPISISTVEREFTTLQSMLSWHERQRKTYDKNPVDGWPRADKSERRRKIYLSPPKVDEFIDAAPPMYQDIAAVQYRAIGMRPGEARLLHKSEVDLEKRTITLGAFRVKTRRGRKFPFPDDLVPILQRNISLSKSRYVFVSPTDPKRAKPIPSNTFTGWARKARVRSGIKGRDGEEITSYHLRHARLNDLAVTRRMPLHLLAAYAGTSVEQLERTYLKTEDEQMEAAREYINDGPDTK